MNQRQLYKMIETIASKKYESIELLLTHVVDQIVLSKEFHFTGGRIWKLTSNNKSYKIIYQTGNIEKITDNYTIKIDDYPVFVQVAKFKTLSAEESNKYLRKKGILKYSLSGVGTKVKYKDYYLYEYLLAFNTDEKNSYNLNYQLSVIGSAVTSVLRRNKAEEKAKRLERDLDQAREIQQSILPEHEYKFGNYEMYGVSLPEQIVGGDFFDYIESTEEQDRVSVVIGDAASKGMSAAIQALYVSGAIRMGMGFHIKIASLLRKINNLVNKTFPYDRFVTLFFVDILNNSTGLCVFANAGHNNPIYYQASTNSTELLPVTGPAIGLSPNQTYQVENINMSKGDILVMYTDGISEAMNSDFDQYTETRLAEVIIKFKDLTAKEICANILQNVLEYSKNPAYSDDKTLVVVKRIN